MDAVVRVRTVVWFATAVVLAVICTLLVTQAWSVGAEPGDSDSTFVPTAGCRLIDTRAASTVGPRNTPLEAGDIFMIPVHGSNGECTGGLAIPTDAVGVALNVTAVNATASSNIRIFPANLTDVPTMSNLNVSAGAPPTPNKVDVKLSLDGEIKIFNFAGSVNVILDVVGYYTNSTLQELSQRVAALEASTADNASGIAALDLAQPFTVTSLDTSTVVTVADQVVVAVTLTAPAGGQVTVNSNTNAVETQAGDDVLCSITTGTVIDLAYLQSWESLGTAEPRSQLAGMRPFDIAAGTSATYNLVCKHFGTSGSSVVDDSVISAIFTPAP